MHTGIHWCILRMSDPVPIRAGTDCAMIEINHVWPQQK